MSARVATFGRLQNNTSRVQATLLGQWVVVRIATFWKNAFGTLAYYFSITAFVGQWAVVRTATLQTNAFGTFEDDFSITTFVGQWAVVRTATLQTNAFGTLRDDISITAFCGSVGCSTNYRISDERTSHPC